MSEINCGADAERPFISGSVGGVFEVEKEREKEDIDTSLCFVSILIGRISHFLFESVIVVRSGWRLVLSKLYVLCELICPSGCLTAITVHFRAHTQSS